MTPNQLVGAGRRPAPGGGTPHAAPPGDRLLLWTAALFTAAVVIHGADHARRGAEKINADVFWLGTAAIALEVAVVVLICQRHRLAPLAAAVTGFSLALGYVVVHFLPVRSWLSDSFPSAEEVSPLSWAAASLEATAALALGIVGLAVLRWRGGLVAAAPKPGPQALGRAATHPLVLAMFVGNVVILAVSVVQRF